MSSSCKYLGALISVIFIACGSSNSPSGVERYSSSSLGTLLSSSEINRSSSRDASLPMSSSIIAASSGLEALLSSSEINRSSSSETSYSSSSSLFISSSYLGPNSSSSMSISSCSSTMELSSSSVIYWNTGISYGLLTDARDGKSYRTVTINNQTWMAENLAWLPSVNRSSQSSTAVPYYYIYGYSGNDVDEAKSQEYYGIYGVLYNWMSANSACPSGWHLPTSDEWTDLETYVGASVAGNKLKANSVLWKTNTGTDDFGFSAIAGGSFAGSYFSANLDNGHWWTSTEFDGSYGYNRSIAYDKSVVYAGKVYKNLGCSVRCIQD